MAESVLTELSDFGTISALIKGMQKVLIYKINRRSSTYLVKPSQPQSIYYVRSN